MRPAALVLVAFCAWVCALWVAGPSCFAPLVWGSLSKAFETVGVLHQAWSAWFGCFAASSLLRDTCTQWCVDTRTWSDLFLLCIRVLWCLLLPRASAANCHVHSVASRDRLTALGLVVVSVTFIALCCGSVVVLQTL